MLSNSIRSINNNIVRWVGALVVALVSFVPIGHAQIFTLAVEQLYVGNVGTQSSPIPTIEVFNVNGGLSWSRSVGMVGGPLAFAQGPNYAIGRRGTFGTLYVALSTGAVEHYEVSLRWGGGMSLVGSHAVEKIPSAMIATPTNLYVANRGSDSISVFSIDPLGGGLTPLQTLTGVTAPGELALDPNQQILVSSGGASFCTMQIQIAGDLSAPMCTQPQGSMIPAKMVFVNGVLYMASATSSALGSVLRAMQVDRTNGTMIELIRPISFGAWSLFGVAKVPGVNAIYVARTGGVTQVTLVSAGFTVAANSTVTGVPASIFADPRGGRLFVTDTAQNQVFALSVASGGALTVTNVVSGTPGQKFPKGMAMSFN